MKQFDFPSKSNSKESHRVTLYDTGRLTCSCRGFRTPNKCWHVKKVAEQEGLNIVIGGIIYGDAMLVQPEAPAPVQESLYKKEESSFVIPVRVMLAKELPDDMDLEDFRDTHVFEQKYDGHRIEFEVGDEIRAWSRAGNRRSFPKQILEEVKQLAPGLYDSELFIPGGTSTDVTALNLQNKLKLAVFDILRVGPQNVMKVPGNDRRELLVEAGRLLYKMSGAPVFIAPQYDQPSRAKLDRIWKDGGEGIILKRIGTEYQEGTRSLDWIKFKKEQVVVTTIVGFESGSLGPHSVVIAQDEAGVQIRVKARNDDWRADFAEKGSEEFIGLKMTVKYQDKTNKSRYRHPMADAIWR